MLPAITVFDVETTGLDPLLGHRIIEIAAVRIENGEILGNSPFHTLVNPERPIPPEAAHINNIRNEDLEGSPAIDEVIPMFLDFAKNSILAAHNAEFDLGFLNNEKQLCWGYVDIPECVCTLKLSRNLFPREFGHSLDKVALRLGLTIPPRLHRAIPDVMLTAKALLKLLEKGKITSAEDLRRLAGMRQIIKKV